MLYAPFHHYSTSLTLGPDDNRSLEYHYSYSDLHHGNEKTIAYQERFKRLVDDVMYPIKIDHDEGFTLIAETYVDIDLLLAQRLYLKVYSHEVGNVEVPENASLALIEAIRSGGVWSSADEEDA